MKLCLPLLLMLAFFGCDRYSTKTPLLRISEQYDPSKLELEHAFNNYVRRTTLIDGTEMGIISFSDGSSTKYWFRSHHISKGIGGTWFEMSDGTKSYMAGYFCYEVQLPEAQMKSLEELKVFISGHDGYHP